MTMLIPALISGAFAGAIMLFFSHIAPAFGAENFIRDLDQPRVFGREVSRREAHLVGIMTHLLLSAIFGGAFALLVDAYAVQGFDLRSIIGWSLVLTLFSGAVVLPLEGHGVFGIKEDSWFPVDLLITNLGWAVLFWAMIRIWPLSVF